MVSIPEPAPLTLIGIALVGLAVIRRAPGASRSQDSHSVGNATR